MRSIEDTYEKLGKMIRDQEEILADIRKTGHGNTIGAGFAMGAIEVLRDLKEWVALTSRGDEDFL